MKRRQSPFPAYTHNFRDRYGVLRSYFRRGEIRVALPEPVLGPLWWEAYRAALANFIAGRDPGRRTEIGAERTHPGTLAAGFVAYTGSAAFKNGLAESTQRVQFNILGRLRDQYGDRRLKDLQSRHVVNWLDERAETPAAAQVFLKVLRRSGGLVVILSIKWRCSLNSMWRSARRFCRHDVLIRFPVRQSFWPACRPQPIPGNS